MPVIEWIPKRDLLKDLFGGVFFFSWAGCAIGYQPGNQLPPTMGSASFPSLFHRMAFFIMRTLPRAWCAGQHLKHTPFRCTPTSHVAPQTATCCDDNFLEKFSENFQWTLIAMKWASIVLGTCPQLFLFLSFFFFFFCLAGNLENEGLPFPRCGQGKKKKHVHFRRISLHNSSHLSVYSRQQKWATRFSLVKIHVFFRFYQEAAFYFKCPLLFHLWCTECCARNIMNLLTTGLVGISWNLNRIILF